LTLSKEKREAILEAFETSYDVAGGDFINAGRASTGIKDSLKQMGIPSPLLRRLAIAAYEAEMNIVMYAAAGVLTMRVVPESVVILARDCGPGIENIDLAMQEGFSTATPEMREMGFGAGMGLPNIKKNADEFVVRSFPGKGTELYIRVNLG
jgi:serine/threonine-protein kinase RsbT